MLDYYNPNKTHTGKLGRDFRLSSIKKGSREGNLHNWYLIFRYLDDGSFFSLHVSPSDKILQKLTHEETLEL